MDCPEQDQVYAGPLLWIFIYGFNNESKKGPADNWRAGIVFGSGGRPGVSGGNQWDAGETLACDRGSTVQDHEDQRPGTGN